MNLPRRVLTHAAAVLLMVPLPGCLVISLQPIYEPGSVESSETLAGTWDRVDDGATMVVARGSWNAYDVTYRDGDDSTRLAGHLTRIGGRLLLDLTPASGVEEPPGMIKTHWPFLIDERGDTLAIQALDYDWFKDHLGAKAASGLSAAMDGEKNVVITADTKGVRDWIAAHVGDPGIWDEAARFTRRTAAPAAQAPAPRETEPVIDEHDGDDYTRYELLAPETAQFRIEYEVTATRTGARHYFNPIRKGSIASDEAVYDRATGQPLPFAVVSAEAARAAGHAGAESGTEYIQVTLPRPVPSGGEIRLRIDKTYKDAQSYLQEAGGITFTRSLGIRRNAVVLPRGYELIACNFPSQIVSEADGRIRVSFMNTGHSPVPFTVKARPLPAPPGQPVRPVAPAARAGKPAVSGPPVPAAPVPSMSSRLAERARQDREIVYFLQQPETHAFALYHDYTERRPGVATYLNVVRAGSRASNPSARLLDTGEALAVETLKGDAVARAGLDPGEPVGPDTEVVVIRFPAVKQGQTTRLRIQETYTDEGRYYLDGDEFVWDRSLGRARNAVVLPAGWWVTASSIPATMSMTADGRVRLDYDNPRPDEVAVLLKARRR